MAQAEKNMNGASEAVSKPQPVLLVSAKEAVERSVTPPLVAAPSTSAESEALSDMIVGIPGTPGYTIKWNDSATISLIHLYQENKYMFLSGEYKKKDIWCLICEIMKDLGDIPQCFTWHQVEQKWKNMTKKYRDCIDYNNRSDTIIPKTCSFYEQLAAVYEYIPKVVDSASSSTVQVPLLHIPQHKSSKNKSKLKHNISSTDIAIEYTENDTTASPGPSWNKIAVKQEGGYEVYTESDVDSPPPAKRKKAAKRRDNSGEMLELLSSIQETQVKQHQEIMQMLQKMHDDKMKLLTELVNVKKNQNS